MQNNKKSIEITNIDQLNTKVIPDQLRKDLEQLFNNVSSIVKRNQCVSISTIYEIEKEYDRLNKLLKSATIESYQEYQNYLKTKISEIKVDPTIKQNIQLILDNDDINELQIADISIVLNQYRMIFGPANGGLNDTRETKVDYGNLTESVKLLSNKINQLISKKIQLIENKLQSESLNIKQIVEISVSFHLLTSMLNNQPPDTINESVKAMLKKLKDNITNIIRRKISLKIKLVQKKLKNMEEFENKFYTNYDKNTGAKLTLLADIARSRLITNNGRQFLDNIHSTRSHYRDIKHLSHLLKDLNQQPDNKVNKTLCEIQTQLIEIKSFLPEYFRILCGEKIDRDMFYVEYPQYRQHTLPPGKEAIHILKFMTYIADNGSEYEKSLIAEYFYSYRGSYFASNGLLQSNLDILFEYRKPKPKPVVKLKQEFQKPKFACLTYKVIIKRLSIGAISSYGRNKVMNRITEILREINPYKRIAGLIKLYAKVLEYSERCWKKTKDAFSDILTNLMAANIENSPKDLQKFIKQIYGMVTVDTKYLKAVQEFLPKLLKYSKQMDNQLDYNKTCQAILIQEQQQNISHCPIVFVKKSSGRFSLFNKQSHVRQVHDDFKDDFQLDNGTLSIKGC